MTEPLHHRRHLAIATPPRSPAPAPAGWWAAARAVAIIAALAAIVGIWVGAVVAGLWLGWRAVAG